MSNMNLPGPLPTSNPPAGAPGDPRVRTPPDRTAQSIRMMMGVAYKTLGDELLKERPDPMGIAKGIGMLQQVMATVPRPGAAPQAAPSGVDLQPRTGIPRPVDRPVDALTGMAPQGGTIPAMR